MRYIKRGNVLQQSCGTDSLAHKSHSVWVLCGRRGGSGAWITLSIAVVMFGIFLLGLKWGEKDIRAMDIVFFVAALAAIPLWLVVAQPLLSMMLLTAIDVLGFAPTIRKSWSKPESETLSSYAINGARHALSVFALAEYNLLTVLFPIAWVFINMFFVVFLVWRKSSILLSTEV